jgi:hypothetical protein
MIIKLHDGWIDITFRLTGMARIEHIIGFVSQLFNRLKDFTGYHAENEGDILKG